MSVSYKANRDKERGGEGEEPVSSDQNTETEEDEEAPLITRETQFDSPKVYHPFIKLLLAIWPFGDAFKELSIIGKIYETLKVSGSGI